MQSVNIRSSQDDVASHIAGYWLSLEPGYEAYVHPHSYPIYLPENDIHHDLSPRPD